MPFFLMVVLGIGPPASVPCVAEITGVYHHTQCARLFFKKFMYFFQETGDTHTKEQLCFLQSINKQNFWKILKAVQTEKRTVN